MDNKEWLYNKRVRELEQEIVEYERHAQREIENNKVTKEDKIRYNSQRHLQLCYKRYQEFTGDVYHIPKFKII